MPNQVANHVRRLCMAAAALVGALLLAGDAQAQWGYGWGGYHSGLPYAAYGAYGYPGYDRYGYGYPGYGHSAYRYGYSPYTPYAGYGINPYSYGGYFDDDYFGDDWYYDYYDSFGGDDFGYDDELGYDVHGGLFD